MPQVEDPFAPIKSVTRYRLHPSAAVCSETTFRPARRVNESLTADLERRALQWMARHVPQWINSDHLTLLGLVAQAGAGMSFALARRHRLALPAVIVCVVLNWLGDSLDGTLARVRGQQRPRYGFYVDHMVDVFGAAALMCGLALSGLLHWQVALAALLAFLLLACESYLAVYALSRFQLSQGLFGPTEIRLLLITGTLFAMHSRYVTVFGHKLLLFDIGGTVAAICMLGLGVVVTVRHTAQLYREEPLPRG